MRASQRWPLLLALAGGVAGCSQRSHPLEKQALAMGPQAAPNPAPAEPAQTATGAPAPPDPPKAAPAPAPAPERAPLPEGDRIWSKGRFAWIQPEPHPSKGWLGYLGLAGSVRVKDGSFAKAKVRGSEGVGGCRAWYAVEPRGFMCDGDAATIDANDPVVKKLALDAPHTESPWPYEYGESTGAPRYVRVPTAAQQKHDEWDLAEHLGLVAKARAGETVDKLSGIDVSPAAPGRWGQSPDPADWQELGPLVRDARKRIADGSTVAWTRSFEAGGRTFVVTHDHTLVPKDRIKPYPRSEFEGVEIGEKVSLPIAFFRAKERPKYRKNPDGTFVETGDKWPRLAWVGLTGDSEKDGKRTFLATREPGIWVLQSDAAVARAADHTPAILDVVGKGGRRTWVEVSVLGGTLVAYEDSKPVFATLISPGRGGVPAEGKDPLDTASTPTGTYRVDGKFVTATMVSSTNDLLVHTEVNYVQNFHGPHALHGAYWHDSWGEKKSGGCVNLAPKDAQRLFHWSEPPVPEGWYGMRSVAEAGPATVVVVHK